MSRLSKYYLDYYLTKLNKQANEYVSRVLFESLKKHTALIYIKCHQIFVQFKIFLITFFFGISNFSVSTIKFGITLKIMSQSGENEENTGAAAASTPKIYQQETPPTSPPPYLRLNADCYEHIFDYLSLKDILRLGETCKRMHQMAGYYFREYFPELRFNLIGKEVQVAYPHRFHLGADFFPYISKLCILKRSELDTILNGETFCSLKTLIFMSVKLDETHFDYTRNVLNKIEDIQIEHCDISVGIFKKLAAACPKLKSLRVEYGNTDMANITKSLFAQHYPTLEHMKYKPNSSDMQVDELKSFLEKHTELTDFECNLPFLWPHRHSLCQTNVQLNLFIIDFTRTCNIQSDQFVDFLKTLHVRGFYKALQLSMDRITDNVFEHSTNAIFALPAFEILDINTDSTFNLTRLTNLKELHVYNLISTDMDALAKSLTRIERLSFGNVSINDLLPFICKSKRLKSIHIDHLRDNGNGLDLFALNEKRETLTNARQVTICVREEDYLATKWRTRNLNLNLVRISRAGSEYF